MGYPGEGPPRTYLEGRGTSAIGQGHTALGRSAGHINRLHAHATSDTVALSHYVPAVRKWLAWSREFNIPMGSVIEMDRSMADYLAHMCYALGKSLNSGITTLSAAPCIFVELQKGGLPEASRAIVAWRRFDIQGEGAPIPWSGVGAISRWLSEQPDQNAQCASHIVLLSADMYLRQSDWCKLIRGDVAASPKYGLALTLGVPERGESAKTGVRQGVRPDFQGSEDLLNHYRKLGPPEGPLFPINTSTFGVWWRKALAGLEYSGPGPPHTLRHVGPSSDIMMGYRTLEQVRIRGRWKAPSSCLRYAKSHSLIKAGEALTPKMLEYGEHHLQVMGFAKRDPDPRS